MTTFSEFNLHADINKAIAICGYTTPTPIQAKTIPSVMEGKDVVASAQTGTGKTAAFVLPALNRLKTAGPSKKTRILILTPTRELASQITKAAMQYGKFLRFNIVNLVGGMPYPQQIRELSRGADIIVATPGRLLDHMESKRVDLSNIEMLVLDEADRMLDMGFIEDVEYIAKLTPENRQTLMFSATVDKQLTTVVRHLLKNPVRIDLSTDKMSVPQIDQQLYKANNMQHKTRMLRHFLNDENIFKAIIFTATKINADKLSDQLRDDGYAAAALHGDLRQNVRNRTVEQLRSGKIQYLVATDVAARGIDIADVTHVFNYDMPRFCEDYVHRIGRTGRAGKSGVAISFASATDAQHVKRIEKFIGQRLRMMPPLSMADLPRETPRLQEASYSSDKSDVKIYHREPSMRRDRDKFGDKKRFSDRKEFKRSDDDQPRGRNRFADKPDNTRSDDAPRERRRFADKPEFSRNDDAPRGRKRYADKSDFPGNDNAPHGRRRFGDKPEFSRDDNAPRSRSRFADKPDYAHNDDAPRGRKRFGDKPNFSRNDDAPHGRRRFGDKPEFSRSDDAPRERKRFGEKREFSRDDNAPRERKRFGEKREFSRDDNAPRERKRFGDKPDYSRNDDAPRGRKNFADKPNVYRKENSRDRYVSKEGSAADRPFKKRGESKPHWKQRDESSSARPEGKRHFAKKDRSFSDRGSK